MRNVKKHNDIKNSKEYNIIFFTIMCLMIINIICINWFKLDDFLNSDIMAEMSYIKIVCEQKSFLPFNWVNSQELFINRPVYIAAPLYLMTGNLVVSYKLTIIMTTIIIMVAFGYFLKQLNIEFKNIMLAMICLLGLYCNEITRIIFLFLNAYSLFPITIFFTLGFYIKNNIKQMPIKNKRLKVTMLYLVAFVMGVSGPRLTIILYLPIFIIEAYEYLIELWKNGKIKVKVQSYYNGLGLLIVNCFGYLIYKLIIIRIIEHNEISNFMILPMRKIIDGIPGLLESLLNSFGLYGNIELISFKGIDFIIKSLLLILIILLLIYIIKEKNKLIRKTIIFFGSSLGLVMVYTVLTNEIFSERYYFMILFFEITILVIGLQKLKENNVLFRNVIYIGIIISVIVNVYVNFIPIYRTEGNTVHKKIANYLVENNYKLAYATYWNADILKGLSNDKIETGHFAGDGFTPYLWLTNKNLYNENLNTSRIAIILTNQEEDKILALNNNDSMILKNMQKSYQIEDYNIYTTTSNPIVKTDLPRNKGEKQNYDFTKRYALKDFKNITIDYENGYIISNNNGGYLTWGPNINTREGEYSFKLNYEVIESISEDIGYFDIALNAGNIQKAICKLERGNMSIILDNIIFENNADTLEYRVYINPGTIIKLNSIEILKEN